MPLLGVEVEDIELLSKRKWRNTTTGEPKTCLYHNRNKSQQGSKTPDPSSVPALSTSLFYKSSVQNDGARSSNNQNPPCTFIQTLAVNTTSKQNFEEAGSSGTQSNSLS